jgi:hypothetical protein
MSMIFCISIAMVEAIDINNCGILGFAEEKYTLIANVSTTESVCFTITAPDVTLDCNSFSINMLEYSKHSNANTVYSNQSNTIIKNCNESLMNIIIDDNQNNDYSNSAGPSKRALFDIVSEIVSEPKKPEEDLIVKISLINFGAAGEIDAHLEYLLLDSKGKAVKQFSKTIPVKTQTEFLEHINTMGMINGKYTLKINLKYDGQTFPASSEKVFYIGTLNVISVQELFKNNSIKITVLTAISLILIIGVYRKSRQNRLKENIINTAETNSSAAISKFENEKK